jgi:hypothetical protein
MSKSYVMLFCCVLLSASCKFSSGKQNILPVDTIKVIMWDLLRADELYIRLTIKDSTAAKHKENIRMFEEIYAIHHVTKGQFDSSFKYYEAHPIIFKKLIDSLDAYANREKNKLTANHGQAKPASKDSAKVAQPAKPAK